MNYELIEYEFIEMIYILFIKKLPSTKETEENKKKYQDAVEDLFSAQKQHAATLEKERDFRKEARYIRSDKAAVRARLREKRRVMEAARAEREEEQRQREREERERELMQREDVDIKDVEFEEEESEF